MDKRESNYIKLVAVITMLIDHIGAFIYPFAILRIIGRIAFPLFAYQLTVGYQKTSSRKKYLNRLFFFAVISQIPYYFIYASIGKTVFLNILFSLMLGIFTISVFEKKKFIYLFLIIPASFFVEYGFYGLLTILIFYFFKKREEKIVLFSLATFSYAFIYQLFIQIYALFSLFFIFGPKIKINLPRYFFYIFYPVHLIVLYIIKIIFFNF
ncbi:MAG: TraX family protein [Candidatus Pacebacteria bacterium]|nr:TraX family protein [Candidatus Paceibacterota bacterium]MDD3728941.1 TraX family protein [Candidatus Paceibacterota bacterium]MDD4201557.1 TraX family protein [Candidatus Paceibacterota bacterium]MDD4467404.1 TraX family protein [Candidatus Paceibacterota bacterium]MDD5445810.1 TraX family protein [Candidatus Paceibacterota bacterium]